MSESSNNAAVLQHIREQEQQQADLSLNPVQPLDDEPLSNIAAPLPSQRQNRSNTNSANVDEFRHTMAPHLNREVNSKSAQSINGRQSAAAAGNNGNQINNNNNNTYDASPPSNINNNTGASAALIVAAADIENKSVVLCGECGADVATFECIDCGGEWYCRPCAIIVHSKGRRKSHAQFKEHPVCDICRAKLATLLCEKCDEVYCTTKCAYGAHDGSPRNGSKKRTHQWEALPAEGLAVKRPPHLEHAVDTRGGRNSFGIALTELNMARYDGIDEDFEELDGYLGDAVSTTNNNQVGGDRGNGRSSQQHMNDVEMRDDDDDGLLPSRLSNNRDAGGQARLTQSASGNLVLGDTRNNNNADNANNTNNTIANTQEGSNGALTILAAGTSKKDAAMTMEEKVASGKATESHFASESPIQTSRRARQEIHAAVAARNLPAPDLDEVVTLVTSVRDNNNNNNNNNNGSGVNDNTSIAAALQHQGSHGALITNSVRGAKAAQLIVENGMTLVPATDIVPERLLMAGITDKLETASKKRNECLLQKLKQGAARVADLASKIHGWRRWDFIRQEPAFFGTHPTPLTVYRPLPPLLPLLADIGSDGDFEHSDTGFASYVPFFERSCNDDAFLLAVASILASNGCQHVKTVRLEEGGDAENGIFTPRVRGGPVINVVAPGFDGPETDNRQQKKKALEKADAAMPCPIGNIFLTMFASCERLHDLGLATFRFFKPTTGDDLLLGRQRQLLTSRATQKATNGVAAPVLEAVEHFVTVDTLFPVFDDGRPAFGRTDVPDEFWLALLEKAYATMKGPEGYASLCGGSPVDPLFALCGGEPTQLQWNLQQLDSSAFASGADIVSPLAMRARVVGLAWWLLQVATQYNLPICVTKRHDGASAASANQQQEPRSAATTWYQFESGLDQVEKFDWKGGDVVFFAVNHSIDRNIVDAQQYLDDEDDRSSNKSGATSAFGASFAGRSGMTGGGLGFGVNGGGHAIQSGREEHRLVKLRQLYNSSRNNDKLVTVNGASAGAEQREPLLPLWHDGSNKWSDIASRVSGATGVAAFAARRVQQQQLSKSHNSATADASNAGSFAASVNAVGRARPPAGSSVRDYAESVLSRKDTAGGGGAGGPNAASLWTKGTRKALQHNVADERLAWMDIDTFAQKYNTILIAQNMPQHKHHTFFASIDMRVPEHLIAKTLPHYLVVVDKRELENSDEVDDRKWAEGLDSQFNTIADVLKPPRSMKEDLGIGDKNETDDAAEDENAAGNGNNNDDATSVASSQVSIAESLADMGTMGSRRSLVLRITVTQPTTKVDLTSVVSNSNAGSLANADAGGKGAASVMMEETQGMMDALTSFKSVMQPEDLTLYAFRVSEPGRQQVTTSLGAKGEAIYSLPIHTKCPINAVDDPIAIGPVPTGLHQVVFEMEANPGAYNLVVAPTRGMGRTDLSSSSVANAHFSMHICSVRNGENFEVKAGRV